MIAQFDKYIYQYILSIELTVFMRQKMDPFTMESHMTILEFQQFVTMWTNKVEEDNKQQNREGNRLIKSLIAIRDILNYMTLKE